MRNIKFGSSYWLGRDFDNKLSSTRNDLTKLAGVQRAIGNFVNIVTGKQIPVQFHSNDSSYTDGKTVVIGAKLDGKNFDPAVGLALHEGSHIAFTDFNIIRDCNRLGGVFHRYVASRGLDPDFKMTISDLMIIKDLLNWVEDRRIDYHVYKNAPGYRVYYEAMYNKYFNDKVIDLALKNGEKTTECIEDYMFHIINFVNPNRDLSALAKLKDIWNIVDLANIQRLKSTQDALDVACKIYKELTDVINSEANQASGNGNGDDDDEDDVEFEIAEGSGNSNMPTKSVSELTDKQKRKLAEKIQAQRDFMSGNVKKEGRLTKRETSTIKTLQASGTEDREITIEDAGSVSGEVTITTTVIKKFVPAVMQAIPQMFETSAFERYMGKLSHKLGPRSTDMDTVVSEGILLGRQLGKKLQIRSDERSLKTTRLQAGKIDRRLIASIGYGVDTIFHRIVTDKYKKYFIHISIDASGSMAGDKFRQAIKSAVAIAQAASMTSGIRVQISLRGTIVNAGKHKSTLIYVYDSAADKIVKIKTMFKYLTPFGLTPEGIAFKSIIRDVKADAKGDECIFINYSDGMPYGVDGPSYHWSGVEYTRQIINEMRGLGIGILSYFISNEGHGYLNDFRRMYGKDAEIINPTQLTHIARSLNRKFLEKSGAL